MARTRFLSCQAGGGAAEFALVLPLLLLFLFGTIDAGRAMWTWNQASKATQMGARHAVVTDLLPAGLADYSYSIDGGVLQGEPVGSGDFEGVRCTSTGCECKAENCGAIGETDAVAFARLVARMQNFLPSIEAANVVVDYDWSGLGYAGDPNGPDVHPLVTVKLRDLTFQPVTLIAFRGTIAMPDFAATLTLEDGAGTDAN